MSDVRFLPAIHRFARSVTVGISARDRKTVLPRRGLQVHDAAERPLVLEMHEPPLSRGRVYKSALVRAVDRSLALIKDDLSLIRSVDVFRSQGELPSGSDTARG